MHLLRKTVASLCVIAMTGAAFAQAPSIGTVTKVEGLATLNDGTVVSNATVGAPIRDGMTIVTSSTGNFTMTLSSGCVVTLEPNKMVTVNSQLTCTQLIASVQSVPGAQGGAVFAGGSGAIPAVIGMTLLGVAVARGGGAASHQ